MRVCYSIVREIKKAHGKVMREDVIEDMIDLGVPREYAEELLHKDYVEFSGDLGGGESLYIGVNIVDDEESEFAEVQ